MPPDPGEHMGKAQEKLGNVEAQEGIIDGRAAARLTLKQLRLLHLKFFFSDYAFGP